MTVAAIVTIALLLLIFIFFGLRWFNTPDPNAAKNGCTTVEDPSGNQDLNPWPPSINLCPDFMVAYTDSSNNILCYDIHNTYEMKTYNGGGLTTSKTINGVSGQSAYTLKNAGAPSTASTADRHPLISLFTPASGSSSALSVVTGDPKAKYLRWEGVYDGTTAQAGARFAGHMP